MTTVESPSTAGAATDDVFAARDGDLTVRLRVPASAEVARSRAAGITLAVRLKPGEHHDLVAEFARGGELDEDPPDPEACWRATRAAWLESVPDCKGVLAGPDVARSLAVLRGMTDDHGGTVAAATTSLPERDDGDKDYDYRFCWIRDTCYVGRAGASVDGAEVVLDDAVRWVGERLRRDGSKLTPAYLGDGSPIFAPERLNVEGFPGGNDVIGNRVVEQFQLDVFGEALLLFARAAASERLDPAGWDAARIALEAIEARWEEPEAGIWELDPRRWTHSRLICVAGLRAIAGVGAPVEWRARAIALADHLLDRTNETSLDASGRWRRAQDDDGLDASLLLAEVRGALEPTDPRSEATRAAVVGGLVQDHYVYRFHSDGAKLGDEEGAFLICNFWMTLAMLGAGDAVSATRYFERGRAAMSTTGLFTEEYDTGEHQLRGNLPQAFVHAAFVEAAAALGPC